MPILVRMKKYPYAPLALSILLAQPVLALSLVPAKADIVASPWLDFREAQIRLLAETRPGADGKLKAGLEIRLAPAFKTYWRTAGDSGVPPVFDFSASSGLKDVRVSFPLPARFDDGAGGKAWGYKHAVLLPVTAERSGGAFTLDLTIDFAVCGTMCIPLNGHLTLDSISASPLPTAEAAALDATIALLPVPAPEAPAPAITRLKPLDPPQWTVRLPYSGDAGTVSAFPEGKGFLDASAITPDGAGHVLLTITGQSEPGSGGKFGPVRLTYGTPEKAFERMLDLDGAQAP
jgi:hypothetical protein